MNNQERSESGNPIYRHEHRRRDMQSPLVSCVHLEEIENHFEHYLGPIEAVYHEVGSDIVHLDVIHLPANHAKPFHTLVTSGMSDLPMTVPRGAEDFRYAELMMNLPPDWPIDDESFKHDQHFWPIRWLKLVGRLPHEFQTWIGCGHTIPNGDPPQNIANTRFTGVMVTMPHWFGEEFFQMKTTNGYPIWFYNLMPLIANEMEFKLKRGADPLETLFQKHAVGKVVDPHRLSVVGRN